MAVALALYRKYRPATFAEVVGQEHVTEPLRTALASGRINHAYLFSGPRGCGKTSSARILARSLNCAQGPTPDPCGVCASCVALAPEGPGSLDVVELDAASHGGVDDTRELRDRAFYMPAKSRYRVFIIDEAHMVSNQGFNALLKIVEEPPEHLVFIFATTEPEKVLPTIRSRTHHYPFHLLPPAVLRGLLEKLCGEEGVAVEPAVYPLVVRAGAGSARDALSVMDQLLAGAGPDGVTYPAAVALLGVTDAALLDEMVDALAAADAAGVFGAVERVAEAGHDPRRFGADLLQRLRDLVILQAVPDAAGKGLIDAPADQLAAMVGQAERLPTATLTRFAEILHTGLTDMRGTTSPRLVLELLAARMLLPAATLDDAGLLQRLERVERRLDIAAEHAEQAGAESPAATRPKAPAPAKPAAARTGTSAAPTMPDATPVKPVAAPAKAAAAPTEPVAAPAKAVAAPVGPDLGLPAPPVLASRQAAADRAPESAPSPPGTSPAVATTGPVSKPVSEQAAEPAPEPAAAPAASPTPESAAEPAPGTAGTAPPGPAEPATRIGVTDVRRLWPQVLESVKGQNRRAHALLESAAVTVVRVEGGVLLLSTQFPALARMVSEARNADLVQTALRDILGVDWRIRCVEAGADGAAADAGGSGPAGAASAQQPGARSASGSADAPRRSAAASAASGAATARRRDTHGSASHVTGDQPPDEEPDRGRTPEPPPAGVEDDADYDPYRDIDPETDQAAAASYQVHDPSKVAIELLTAKLGARPIDEP
jgi:DNA polymerase-3 subunit gamma/tau